ncbi:hypothetical protein B2J93_4923 [Marssonina coronariae]|uniref:2EXR domain-containing protein n=1 Tax=Diplocarpon coronariae TaxID=2795749 RepID=A0A218ZE59_9HELO|nr:hypothetical protein B2J93_4923 [Marssonina coronariae]
MTKREHGSDYETVRCSFSSKAPGKLPSERHMEVRKILHEFRLERQKPGPHKIKLIFKKPAGSTPQTRLAGLRNLLSQLSLSELRAFQTAYTPRGEFELFRKLPPELRRMIWRTAMPHQRVVELIYHHKDIVYGWPTQDWDYWYEDFYSTPRNFKFRTHEEVPVVFQVCQESRREASKKYTLRLDTNLRRSLNLIDPVNDMLYITSFEDGVRQRAIIDSKIWKDEAYRQIKHLSITMNLWTSTLLGTWGDIVPSNGRYPLDKFTSLRDFTLVVHAHNCDQSYENRDRTRELGLVDTPAEYLSAARPDVNIVAERAKLESEFAYFVAQNPRCGPRQVKTAILTVGGTPCCIHPPAEDEAAAEGTEAEGGIDEAEGYVDIDIDIAIDIAVDIGIAIVLAESPPPLPPRRPGQVLPLMVHPQSSGERLASLHSRLRALSPLLPSDLCVCCVPRERQLGPSRVGEPSASCSRSTHQASKHHGRQEAAHPTGPQSRVCIRLPPYA